MAVKCGKACKLHQTGGCCSSSSTRSSSSSRSSSNSSSIAVVAVVVAVVAMVAVVAVVAVALFPLRPPPCAAGVGGYIYIYIKSICSETPWLIACEKVLAQTLLPLRAPPCVSPGSADIYTFLFKWDTMHGREKQLIIYSFRPAAQVSCSAVAQTPRPDPQRPLQGSTNILLNFCVSANKPSIFFHQQIRDVDQEELDPYLWRSTPVNLPAYLEIVLRDVCPEGSGHV